MESVDQFPSRLSVEAILEIQLASQKSVRWRMVVSVVHNKPVIARHREVHGLLQKSPSSLAGEHVNLFSSPCYREHDSLHLIFKARPITLTGFLHT